MLTIFFVSHLIVRTRTLPLSLTGSTPPGALPLHLHISACLSGLPVDVCIRAFVRDAFASSGLGLTPRLNLDVHVSVHTAAQVLRIVLSTPWHSLVTVQLGSSTRGTA